ncbi:hypothetical protein P7L87_25465 [Vibrio parahaemolyticus]|nr:hypothetical protein [Vibrio parahaemolyticus]
MINNASLKGLGGTGLLAGLVLLVSPVAFSLVAPANTSAIILGFLVILIAGKAIFAPQAALDRWMFIISGLVVLITPWVLGFSSPVGEPGFMTHAIAGVLLAAAGVWALLTHRDDSSLPSGGSARGIT